MIALNKPIQRAGMHVGKEDKPATAADGLAFSARYNSVGADYFAAVGLPVLRGRVFTLTEAAQPGNANVAIIDEALARKLWPDGEALGRRIGGRAFPEHPLQRGDGPRPGLLRPQGFRGVFQPPPR